MDRRKTGLSFGHEAWYKTERPLLPIRGMRHEVEQGVEFPYSLGRGQGYQEEHLVGEEALFCFPYRLVGLISQALQDQGHVPGWGRRSWGEQVLAKLRKRIDSSFEFAKSVPFKVKTELMVEW